MIIKHFLLILFIFAFPINSSFATDIDDPWEPINRSVHGFNMIVDEALISPVSAFYSDNVNDTIKVGVSNFFTNIRESKDAINLLLQGKFKDSAIVVVRVSVNTTVGLAGVLDVAQLAGLNRVEEEDFGQTLAVWGVGSGPYLVLPLLGPSSVRDAVGFWADVSNMESFSGIYNIDQRLKTTLNVVNERVKYDIVFDRLKGSEDSYSLAKSLYLQKRDFDIIGDDEIDF